MCIDFGKLLRVKFDSGLTFIVDSRIALQCVTKHDIKFHGWSQRDLESGYACWMTKWWCEADILIAQITGEILNV